MTLRQSDSAPLSIPITMCLGAVLVVCFGHVEPTNAAKVRPAPLRRCVTATPQVFALLIGSPIAPPRSASRTSLYG
jgi:hypothetical protein